MSQIGDYLKNLREGMDRSRRWVERQSRALYTESDRWVSHSYLRQIELGLIHNPSPPKLRTLANVYGVDYNKLLASAGYLESARASDTENIATNLERRIEIAEEMIIKLEGKGISSEDFMSNVIILLNSEHIETIIIPLMNILRKY